VAKFSSNGKGNGHDGDNGRGHDQHGNGNGYGHIKHHEAPEPPPPDYTDNKITVVTDDGRATMAFDTFAAALQYSNDGDTLQVGAGTYNEIFELNEDVTILGEAGSVLSGANFVTTVGQQATIELLTGASGATISGLTVVAISDDGGVGGNAISNEYGVVVSNVDLTGNTFSAGTNTSGAVVYLNPGASDFDLVGNTFVGPALNGPFLGLDVNNGFGPADADINVLNNRFGNNATAYPEVEIFGDPGRTEVTFIGNTGVDGMVWA
jgi:hypothetical protein